MPNRSSIAAAAFALLCITVAGCSTPTTTRQALREHVLRSESDRFGSHAVYMGDSEGYHYFKVRSIYSIWGDHVYRIPSNEWELPKTFALSDNANRWQNVTWVDADLLSRSRYGYVLLKPSEPVSTGAFTPMTFPTSMPQSFPSPDTASPAATEPTTQTTTAPAASGPATNLTTAPSTSSAP